LQLIPEYGTFEIKSKMARNTSVILGEHFDDFIKSEIDSGRFKSASEIIRSGLRLLEDEKHKIQLINEALIIGEMSGEAIEFDNEKFKRKMRKNLKKNA
jgi:antitoxin ParD1/3/4